LQLTLAVIKAKFTDVDNNSKVKTNTDIDLEEEFDIIENNRVTTE